MRLYDLLSAANIDCPDGAYDIEVTSIVTDSRKVTRGCMFICIRGLRTDSHNFIKNAVDRGASVIVHEALRDMCVGGAAAVEVKNTRRAAAMLYDAWYSHPAKNMKIVGVTGTNGKTSVSYILKKVFEKSGKKCGLIGTLGCMSGEKKILYGTSDSLSNMTTPDPEDLYRILFEMRQDGVEYVFIEATSHASALCKLDAIYFDTLVFTNLTQDHLDFHGNMNEYFAAKATLFRRARTAVINFDDSYAKGVLSAFLGERAILCSLNNENAEYFASDIGLSAFDGVSYRLRTREGVFDVKLPSFFGGFSVINSLEAIAVAKEYGIEYRDILRSFESLPGVPGRMEKVELPRNTGFSVYLDYAHTPDALEKSLLTLREIKGEGRIITLFGCGGERDRGKRRLMGNVASALSDFVIVTSDNSRSEDKMNIISDIYRGIDKEKAHKIIPDREEAIIFAVSYARVGDILLLAGKGHEKYEINSTGRHPFDEKNIVMKAVLEK